MVMMIAADVGCDACEDGRLATFLVKKLMQVFKKQLTGLSVACPIFSGNFSQIVIIQGRQVSPVPKV